MPPIPRPPRRPSRLRRLGRSTALIIIAALLFIANVVINLFSTAIEPVIKAQVGDTWYSTYLFVAMVIFLALAIAVYLYDHRASTGEDAEDTADGGSVLDPEIAQRNRQTLIADVRLRITERLDSAPKLIPLRLAERAGMVEPPGALIRPYDIVHRRTGQPDELLPARTKIADLYTEHNHQLLILGAPGAGKTFLLHELARDLVDVAARDESAPIPVIFSLASWQPDQPLDTWLVADLARRFGAKPSLFARLLRAGALLPLLDGLDEVATLELRIQCVAAINAFRQSQDLLPPLIVTCREREYADLPLLQVNAAIAVQPLAPAQIDRYLAGPTFEQLRATLRSDAQLRDLARTPLLLGLLAATYRDRAPQIPTGNNATALRAVVLGDYVDHCLVPVIGRRTLRIPASQLRTFLSWLASQLAAHDNQQDFYLEFLQPDWLPSRAWRWVWRAMSSLALGLVGGLVFGLVGGLVGGLVFGLAIGLVGGLVNGLLFGLGNIMLVETLAWSWMRFRSQLRDKLVFGLGGGLAIGLISGLAIGLVGGLISGLAIGLVGGLISGLAIGLALILTGGFQKGLLSDRATVNQGIHRSMRSAIIGGLALALVVGPIFGLFGGLGVMISIGLVIGLFQYGGPAVVKHYVLRLLLPLCTPAPLNFALWLEEAHRRGLLVRVGGGYRFYHELFQRHFAAPADSSKDREP